MGTQNDTVYVFNLYSEKVTSFSTNGCKSAGTIDPPDQTATAPYTPSQLAVPRTWESKGQLDPSTDPSQFVIGENDISVDYGHSTWVGQVVIPDAPEIPKDEDLWLYLAYEQAFLFNAANGALIVNPSSGAAATLRKM